MYELEIVFSSIEVLQNLITLFLIFHPNRPKSPLTRDGYRNAECLPAGAGSMENAQAELNDAIINLPNP
jgi:hypothetical protein